MIDWNQKTVAHLHDPPEKAYDYSRTHIERAAQHLSNLKVPGSAWKGKEPDHAAAAADRFIFPATRKQQGNDWVATGVGNLGGGLAFNHPLTGQPALGKADFPREEDAHDIISHALPDFADKDAHLKFWLLWRLWLQFSVDSPHGRNPKAGNLAYLPADTRIPDGSIWNHMSVVSALESTRGADGKLRPAFLTFQLGPVQEFIAQARSTRDFWSGSYLLSWMMAHVLKGLADKFGPDCVIYPNLKGQPLYDWLEQEKLKQAYHTAKGGERSPSFWDVTNPKRNQDLALTPNLPNRCLVIVPENAAKFFEDLLKAVFDAKVESSEWRRITDKCWEFVHSKEPLPKNARSHWDFQIANFWQLGWQLWPWRDVESTIALLKEIPTGKDSSLPLARDVAWKIPDEMKDGRCYKGRALNSGWAWSAHYQLLSHRHNARRQTRDFKAWRTYGRPGHKDHFSGKEEAIATKAWLEQVRKSKELGHLFRQDNELGAVNLVKRVWHKAHLAGVYGFRTGEFKFNSVLSIASAPWIECVKQRLIMDDATCHALVDFKRAVEDAWTLLDFELCSEKDESVWLDKVDPAVFQSLFWERMNLSDDETALRDKAVSLLRELLAKAKAGIPGKYYAVLALDGDRIGKWLNGEMTPEVQQVITEKAADWFKENMKEVDVQKWLESNRPLSPSYHLQFSEALSNFGLYCARRIVEAHHGQLVYAGGDDVLAMLPAQEAIACAQGLGFAFQGQSERLTRHAKGRYARMFDANAPKGFIRLKDGDWDAGCRRPVEPSWPLLAPGPNATVSVGVCIGHVKEPLQDMIHEAQAAEKRAKDQLGRNALAVTLFKRSGELIRWGTPFDLRNSDTETQQPAAESASLRLLQFIQSNNRYRRPLDNPSHEPHIHGKFPYRLAELLRPYQDYERQDGVLNLDKPLPLDASLRPIAEREVQWAISRQCEKLSSEDKQKLLELCSDYLIELERREKPLSDFVNLFALEAFIARQGE